MSEVLPFAPPTRRQTALRRVERRRWQRILISLPLSFLDESGRENKGHTINISGGGLLFQTETPPFRGDRLVCYVENIGRMSGHVVRSCAGEVALISDAPFMKRDRIVDMLTWLANKEKLKLPEERRASRTTGSSSVLVLTKDGQELRCHVMDMSFVGVALATSDKRPLIGDPVQVGSQRGRVARYLPEGFAVDFTR